MIVIVMLYLPTLNLEIVN